CGPRSSAGSCPTSARETTQAPRCLERRDGSTCSRRNRTLSSGPHPNWITWQDRDPAGEVIAMSESAAARGAAVVRGSRLRPYLWPALALVGVLAVHVAVLRWEGRLWWCACGRPDLWSGDPRGPHN